MNYTTNYNLKKPTYSDPADIVDINDNMDTLDSAVYAIDENVSNINQMVRVISLSELIAASTIYASGATLDGNHYTSSNFFGGIKGFVTGKHYKFVFVPAIGGNLRIRTLESGSWVDNICEVSTSTGVPFVVDIPSTITWGDRKTCCFLSGAGYIADAMMYVYDVSNLTADEISNIDFTLCANPIVYKILIIPQHVFHNYLTKENILSGKKAFAMGDSLTATGSGGQYLPLIKDGLNLASIADYSIGGSAVCGQNANSFWKDVRVNALSADADVLFILGGTNDCTFTTVSESDFSISNSNTDNFVGAYNVLISKVLYKYLKLSSGYYSGIDYSGVTQLQTANTGFRIVLITPPKRFDTVTNMNNSATFAEHVKRIGAMWGLPVCDVNSQMNMNIVNKGLYFGSSDFVHFNSKGHAEMANIIIGKVKSLN